MKQLLFCLALLITQHGHADTITASVSTVAWRAESLEQSIASMLPQVDRLNVFLQGYESIPAYLNHPKIIVALGSDHPEALALGDAAKFFWADSIHGYHFIMDDDLDYAPDYVAYCIEKIEQYSRKAIVGLHGSILKEPIRDYFKDRTYFAFGYPLKNDTYVNMLGTGIVAYHTDTITLSIKDFKQRNMADIWLALAAQKQQVPMVCLQRNKTYVKDTPVAHKTFNKSIYSTTTHNRGKEQTAIVKEYSPWRVFMP